MSTSENNSNTPPPVSVKGEILTKSGNKKQLKLRHSNYLITINTNKRYTGFEEHFNAKEVELQNAIEAIFNDTSNLVKIVTFKDTTHNFTRKHIKNINVDYALELAPNTSTLHAHVALYISHYSSIKIDYALMKKLLLEQLKLENIYINNRVCSSSEKNILEYIYKNRNQ